jgi:hypothetical protein
MIPIPNDEMLMAYADGELEPTVASALEQAMVRDPMIAIKTIEFLRSRRLARERFSAEPLPIPSDALLRAAMGETGKPRADRWSARPGLRLLAACIALVAAGALGWGLKGGEAAGTGLALLELPQASASFDRMATGDTFDLPGGQVRAIATMEVPRAGLCRQVELVDASAEVTNALVCRQKGADWKTILALRAEAKPGGYEPAAGNELIDRFLDGEKAGRALDFEAEKRALQHS